MWFCRDFSSAWLSDCFLDPVMAAAILIQLLLREWHIWNKKKKSIKWLHNSIHFTRINTIIKYILRYPVMRGEVKDITLSILKRQNL